MKAPGGSNDAKRAAAEHAAEAASDGMVLGLGTGSTAAHAIRALGRAVDGGLDIRGVATSFQSRALARDAGIPLADLDEVDSIDLAIDGADQAAGPHLVKGGGAAHAREKVVDSAAERFLVVVDRTKTAETLDHPVPVSVLPFAREQVAAAVRSLGGDPTLRESGGKDGPVVTDNGNLVLDCAFGEIDAPDELANDLDSIPGVVAHGLFVGLADAVYVGGADGDVDVLEY